jgi:large subunit ribosomal protein L22
MKTALAYVKNARISLKHSVVICKELKGKKLENAKNFLKNLIEKKISLNGKYHTNAAKKILEALESAGANAKQKGLAEEKLFIKNIKADKGFIFVRPRSRWNLRGRKVKSTNLFVEIGER